MDFDRGDFVRGDFVLSPSRLVQIGNNLKDRQHRSRGGSDFPFINHEPNGVECRVIYQMKGNIYLYIMILSN